MKLVTNLRKLSSAELEARIIELRKQRVEQTRARAAGELANPHAIKKTRRELATALTLLKASLAEAANSANQPEKQAEKEEAK